MRQWRSGAVTGRRGYPPRLRNGSPRRQVVTLWYPPRTIEYESRFPGKAAGRGVRRRWCPGLSACSAIPLPVRSPLSPPPHNSTQSFTHANHSHIHSINITSALIRHPTTAAPAAVAAAPTSRRTAGLGVGSATAATARLRRNRQRRRRNRQRQQNRWRLRRFCCCGGNQRR